MKGRNDKARAWQSGLLLAFLAFTSIAASDVYRWTDEHGRIHFGDKPPADAATEQVDIRVNTYESPQIVYQPSDKSIATAAGRKSVVMYSAAWCGVCKRAAAYFNAKSIPFQEYDVETSARGKADFKRLGGRGVPVILVGKTRMNGFSAQNFEQLYSR
jgi:glutaredoxin